MELLALQIQKVELELQCAASHSEKMQKQKELLDLRTQKVQLELQQATSKRKAKVRRSYAVSWRFGVSLPKATADCKAWITNVISILSCLDWM